MPTSTTKAKRRKPSAAAVEKAKAWREEKIKEANDDLTARLERMANDPAEWVEFLETVAQWGVRYSFGNQCLLLMQCELRGVDPEMFLPYGGKDGRSGWLKEGRQVRKGETAFLVWAPVKRRLREDEVEEFRKRTGRTVVRDEQGRLPIVVVGWTFARTFELGQTEPQEGKPDSYVVPTVEVRRRAKVLGGGMPTVLTGDDPTGIYADIVRMIEAEGYTYMLLERSRSLRGNGVTTHAGGRREVHVRSTLDPAQRTKTAIHELAHIKCRHLESRALGMDLHRGRRETEAESVAHIVCKAFGLDSTPYTDAYVLHWAEGDMDVVKAAADTILRVAKEIVEELAPMEPFMARATDGDESEDAA